jgi:hypothetical protein
LQVAVVDTVKDDRVDALEDIGLFYHI